MSSPENRKNVSEKITEDIIPACCNGNKSAEAYLKDVDGITTRSQGFQNQYQFINTIGSYQIKGIDLLLNKQFNNVISSWIGYSFSKNEYTFDTLNNGASFPNNVDIRHALTVAGTYTYIVTDALGKKDTASLRSLYMKRYTRPMECPDYLGPLHRGKRRQQ